MLRTSKEPPEDVILVSINTWSTLDVDGYDGDRSRCTRYTGCRVGMKPRKIRTGTVEPESDGPLS